jgi:hypothetical protein
MDLVIGGILEQSFEFRTMRVWVRAKTEANAGQDKTDADPPPAAKDDSKSRSLRDDNQKGKGKTKSKGKSKGGYGVGDKRTVVRVSRCWEFFASDTLLGRAVREKNTL